MLVAASRWATLQRAGSQSGPGRPHSLAATLQPDKGSITPAATITVNSTSDVASGTDGLCTLREAITAANTNTASGAVAGECAAGSSGGSDTIDMTGVSGTINLTGALPDITSDLTINGPGSSQLTVTRNTGGDYRVFTVSAPVTVAISGLAVTSGKTPAAPPGSPASTFNGGGIFNSGTLTLTDVNVSANTTSVNIDTNSAGNGAGIANTGTLSLTSCSVTGNFGGNGIGGIGSGGNGGGISSSGTLTVSNSTITGNQGGQGAIGSGTGGNGGGILLPAER
ncbi:MAG TPA: CSLREA domain-containing protein [Pyrinomonadaceae bacterium]|nr:CSLREA domain-containing protein [Pyrinomonadaceae bacterium]